MGMSLQSTGRRGRGRGRQMIGDINVTPLIDLPQTAAPELKLESKPVTVSIRADGEIYLGEEQISLDTLLASVEAVAGEAGTDQRLYIRGDATSDYGLIMQVMGELSNAGYARIGLITRQREVQ